MALRWLTAGESHGEALVGIIEGVPAGVELTSEMVRDALARRRLGYGRGARMKFEEDKVRILGGVRHGVTQGGPIALEIANTEWPKWVDVMSSDPVDPALIEGGHVMRRSRAPALGTQILRACRNITSRRPARCLSAPQHERPQPAWRWGLWRRRCLKRWGLSWSRILSLLAACTPRRGACSHPEQCAES